MHVVRIEDPWWGPYIVVQAPQLEPGFNTSNVIGPLFWRSVRMESIHTEDAAIRLGGLGEKPCQHSYVEGLVTGTVEGAAPPRGQAYTRLAPATGFWSRVMFSDPADYYTLSMDQTVDERIDRVAVSISWVGTAVMHGTITNTRSCGCTVSADRYVDPRTGAISYGTFVITARWGWQCQFIIVQPTTCPYGTQSDSLGGQLDSILYWIDQTLQRMGSPGSHNTCRDAAIYEALENLELTNINWVTDFQDLIHPLQLLKQLAKVLQPPWTPWGILKKFANLHLLWIYVLKMDFLTLKELKVLWKFLRTGLGNVIRTISDLPMIGHGDDVESWTVEDRYDAVLKYTAKVVYGADTHSLSELYGRFVALGLTPTLGDLWDMIPFSFVIDWLIPIQDAIENMERKANTQTLPLRYLLLGRKLTRKTSHQWKVGVHTFTISLTKVEYERTVDFSLPDDMWLGIKFHDPRKHWLTAASLIIQHYVDDDM